MMDKVFVDTNILLDVLFERENYQSSLKLLQMGDDGKVQLCTSVLSMANIAYLLRKAFTPGELAATLAQLSSLMQILPMDEKQFQEALLLSGPDFEDILQTVCAVEGACNILVTHTPRDFSILPGLAKQMRLPTIYTPESYLLGKK